MSQVATAPEPAAAKRTQTEHHHVLIVGLCQGVQWNRNLDAACSKLVSVVVGYSVTHCGLLLIGRRS